MLARALCLQGFADTAMNEAQASLDEVQGRDQPTLCLVLHFGLCKIAPMTGDLAATERAITQLIDLWNVASSQRGSLLFVRSLQHAVRPAGVRPIQSSLDLSRWLFGGSGGSTRRKWS
jgi:hypothetical protein